MAVTINIRKITILTIISMIPCFELLLYEHIKKISVFLELVLLFFFTCNRLSGVNGGGAAIVL